MPIVNDAAATTKSMGIDRTTVLCIFFSSRQLG
jgi:hypothetical protein